MSNKQQVGRLAFRVEGKWWRCYYAMPDTMEDSIELGTILMRPVEESNAVKEAFMNTMKLLLSVMLKTVHGVEAEWPNPPQPAPQSERAGNA